MEKSVTIQWIKADLTGNCKLVAVSQKFLVWYRAERANTASNEGFCFRLSKTPCAHMNRPHSYENIVAQLTRASVTSEIV